MKPMIKADTGTQQKKEDGDMRNIVVLCNMGVSTSLMVRRMRDAAVKQSYECHIEAYALQKRHQVAPSADVILVGPQIAFELNNLKMEYPDKKIDVIDLADYGRMNGEKFLNHVREILGD